MINLKYACFLLAICFLNKAGFETQAFGNEAEVPGKTEKDSLLKGWVKFGAGILDSEYKNATQFSPTAEARVTGTSVDQNWIAQLHIKIQQPNLETSILEANAGYQQEWFKVRAGRLVERPLSISLNEANLRFMKRPLPVDGFELSTKLSDYQLGAFAGSAQIAGLFFSATLPSIQAAVSYRFQKEKLEVFPEKNEDGTTLNSSKVSDSHEAELLLKVPGKTLQADALFQASRQGPFKSARLIDATTGETSIESTDSNLPWESSDYRATSQLKYKLFDAQDQGNWLVVALGTKAQPKYFKGTEEERTLKQSSKTNLNLAGGYEVMTDQFVAQLMVHAEQSSVPSFRILSKRNDSDEPTLQKRKFGATVSATFKF